MNWYTFMAFLFLYSCSSAKKAAVNTDINTLNFTAEPAPESMAESVRQSGLAYSAAIAFFASVVFMLIIGWGADLLFGTSPWGMVAGIVIGSIIGFVQFFRINSRIFNPDRKMKNGRTLLSRDDDAN